jgi:hypothetical protein
VEAGNRLLHRWRFGETLVLFQLLPGVGIDADEQAADDALERRQVGEIGRWPAIENRVPGPR